MSLFRLLIFSRDYFCFDFSNIFLNANQNRADAVQVLVD